MSISSLKICLHLCFSLDDMIQGRLFSLLKVLSIFPIVSDKADVYSTVDADLFDL